MSEKKKVIQTIYLFLLPFFIGWVGLFALSGDKRYQYYFIKDNCLDRSGWIYDRLHYNDTEIGAVFLGSSKTLTAINSEWVADTIRINTANFSICRYGRNMHYTLLKESFKTKYPKKVIVEVCEKENRDGHIDFAYIADARDILLPVWIFNDNIFEDFFKATVVRFEGLKSKWVKSYSSPDVMHNTFGYLHDSSFADKGYLQSLKDNSVKEWKYNRGFARWFYNQYSFNYIDKIVSLAEENSCEVYFLYLPNYGSIPKPEEHEFYSSRGKLLIPPSSILDNPSNWKDKAHFNDYGAQKLSYWVAEQIR